MVTSVKWILGLLACVCWAHAASDEYERMRQLGQNAKFGPNLLTRSKFNRQPQDTAARERVESGRALEDYLLPDDVQPLAYEVNLITFLQDAPAPATDFSFDGHVHITVRAQRPVAQIRLHSRDLVILDVNVTKTASVEPIGVVSWELTDDDTEFLTIYLDADIASGQEYDIDISFEGLLREDGFGYFRSYYFLENFDLDYLATTQFESTGARLAFPCFDEPNSKATFIIALGHGPEYNAVANMPLSRKIFGATNLPSGWIWDIFEESPLMSSYLVAFSVLKFNRLESATDSRFGVWARDSKLSLGVHANTIAPELFNYYEQYTQTNYGMPKVDQLGFQDFFSGAMENWGHISYTEGILLVDPDQDPISQVQLATQVISHELTHQWFGNIISPEWWSDLWLNEGFATYFEFFGTAQFYPEWLMDQQFQSDMMHSAFVSDASVFASHPVHNEVDSPRSIDSMFDNMSYNKGGCLVRFMLNLMGDDNFRSGIINYMNQNAYQGAHQDDLFAALQAHVPAGLLPDGVSFAQLMDTWTMQAGVPVLTVSRDYPGESAVVAQQRFGVNGAEQWIVPLTWTSQALLDFDTLTPAAWLMTAETQLDVGVPPADQWLLLNVQQTAYYRVNYDQQNWDMLFAFLEDPDTADLIHPLNRAQILDDSFALAKFGHLPYSTALASTKYLSHETTLGPWMAALAGLEFLRDRMYQSTDTEVIFDRYMASKLEKVFEHVNGLEVSTSESPSISKTRSLIASWACKSGVQKCVYQGLTNSRLLRSTTDAINTIPKDVRSVSYCVGVRYGDMGDISHYLKRLGTRQDQEERIRILGALGCTSDVDVLAKILNLIVSPVIKEEDALSVFFSVYSNPRGIDLALDFLISNFAQIKNKLNLGVAFMGISEKLNTQLHYQKVRVFLEDNVAALTATEQQMIQGAVTVVEHTLEWNAAYMAQVENFFVQNV